MTSVPDHRARLSVGCAAWLILTLAIQLRAYRAPSPRHQEEDVVHAQRNLRGLSCCCKADGTDCEWKGQERCPLFFGQTLAADSAKCGDPRSFFASRMRSTHVICCCRPDSQDSCAFKKPGVMSTCHSLLWTLPAEPSKCKPIEDPLVCCCKRRHNTLETNARCKVKISSSHFCASYDFAYSHSMNFCNEATAASGAGSPLAPAHTPTPAPTPLLAPASEAFEASLPDDRITTPCHPGHNQGANAPNPLLAALHAGIALKPISEKVLPEKHANDFAARHLAALKKGVALTPVSERVLPEKHANETLEEWLQAGMTLRPVSERVLPEDSADETLEEWLQAGMALRPALEMVHTDKNAIGAAERHLAALRRGVALKPVSERVVPERPLNETLAEKLQGITLKPVSERVLRPKPPNETAEMDLADLRKGVASKPVLERVLSGRFSLQTLAERHLAALRKGVVLKPVSERVLPERPASETLAERHLAALRKGVALKPVPERELQRNPTEETPYERLLSHLRSGVSLRPVPEEELRRPASVVALTPRKEDSIEFWIKKELVRIRSLTGEREDANAADEDDDWD